MGIIYKVFSVRLFVASLSVGQTVSHPERFIWGSLSNDVKQSCSESTVTCATVTFALWFYLAPLRR
jgi:hypothetical protein